MSNQLVKRNPVEGYKNVFPKTFIDAIKDRESGASLEEILQGFNMYFLSYNGSKALTRCRVPSAIRKEGLWITYVLYDHTVVTEWYNSDNIDDESWGSDSNWRIASNALVGDISISTDGYWIINGTTTNIKAQGETGITPLLRMGDNNKIQVTYDEGKNWEDISDYIVPKFRWIQGTGTTAGTIQISMDLGNTWEDLSNPITNNLRISKYIGINDSLPTSGVAEGTVYMKGPYYDENDSLNENPIYRMWIYAWKGNTLAWQDNGEFTSISAGVVQERGNSTTEVMSQDAVTRELTELESVHEYLKSMADISSDGEVITGSAINYASGGVVSNSAYSIRKITLPSNTIIVLHGITFQNYAAIALYQDGKYVPKVRGLNIGAELGYIVFHVLEEGTYAFCYNNVTPYKIYKTEGVEGTIEKALGESIKELNVLIEAIKPITVNNAESIGEIKNELHVKSINLYDSSKQTPDTISPHYYVDGYPYSSTAFDSKYNASALISIEPSTQYTLVLVPAFGSAVVPWNEAPQGVFFYDIFGSYLGSSNLKTFITPTNAAYLRFNYDKGAGVSLERVNTRCMLVKGDVVPATYAPYSEKSLKDLVRESQTRNLYYRVIEDGIEIFQKSGNSKDLAFVLKRKGGNNLFDFYRILNRANESELVSTDMSEYTLMASTATDWHAPFKLLADNNADGDNKNADGTFKNYFTGGNHQYNNSGEGSTSTAKSVRLVFYADGRQVEIGAEGYANHIRVEWSNQVQGQNTTKADGSGRYILQENHILNYDGITFKSSVELIPLEDIHITTWYGLQAVYSNLFNSLRFVDSANRKENTLPSSVSCGSIDKCRGMILKGEELSLFMDIEPSLDLGARVYNKGIYAAFAESYGKVYFGIISTSQCAMSEGDAYYLEGSYSFKL